MKIKNVKFIAADFLLFFMLNYWFDSILLIPYHLLRKESKIAEGIGWLLKMWTAEEAFFKNF